MIAYRTFLLLGQKPGQSLYLPLKYQRLLRGWSQQDVVDELYKLCAAHSRVNIGLTVDTVRCWENGRHLPSPLYRKHLCILYGLTADKLGFIPSLEV
jgi:transcriptional regulator with XRE-family HTH domain